ncbi:unnamed protein product, partial [marine sediment metagenome]
MAARIEKLLAEEIAERGFEDFDEAKYAAYKDACLAFVDERIELYNSLAAWLSTNFSVWGLNRSLGPRRYVLLEGSRP